MSENKEDHYWTEFMTGFQAKWAIAPGCPFCGAEMKKLNSWWTRSKGLGARQHHAVQCLQCGAQGATGETPEEAVEEWSRRPGREWTPLGPHSYVLPMQKLGSLLVHDVGKFVSFIDWIEGDVQEQVDIDLGHFRICYRTNKEKKNVDKPTDIPE